MTIPLTMRPGEVRDYLFDFHLLPEIIVNGETISSITGITGNDLTLTLGVPYIVNVISTDEDGVSTTYPAAGVGVLISGGTDGLTYELLCKAVTSGGHTLICEGTLYVGQPRTS